MRLIHLVLLFLPIFSALGQQQNISLNGKWDFCVDYYNVGEDEEWFSSETQGVFNHKMEVPGNWDLHNEYANYTGIAWYKLNFNSSDEWNNQMVRLVFQSVYNKSKIWINGQFVGENDLGFLPFQFDINTYLKDGENTLIVQVENLYKLGAIWNWGGIRRPVWLEITNPQRIEYQHITALPDLKSGKADIRINTFITNKNKNATPVELVYKIYYKGGEVFSKKQKVTIPANATEYEQEISLTLPKKKVKLWHFDYPELYTSTVEIIQANETTHSYTDRFGIRKLEIDGKNLLLNGENVRLLGFNLVAEDRFTGNTLPLSRIEEDIDLMKQLGGNLARVSHLPLPKEYLDLLDEKGIMTFEEISVWGKHAWIDPSHPKPQEWLDRMIKEKYNHPSVVGWSVGNEIGWLNSNPKVMEYVKARTDQARELDPNRFAVYVSNSAQNQETDPAQYCDLIMLNSYGGWGKAADKAYTKHGKPVFMSEFGKNLTEEDPNNGIIEVTRMMKTMREKEYLFGASVWTINDYRSFWHGGTGWKTPITQNRPWGLVDSYRHRKRAWAEFREEYAPVKELRMETIEVTKGASQNVNFTIIPRDILDLPANTLKDYSVKLITLDKNGKALASSSEIIPTLTPGTAPVNIKLEINISKEAHALQYAIFDPLGYNVYDKFLYLEVPKQPIVKAVYPAQKAVRIEFEKQPLTTEYYATFSNEKETYISDTTINNFITIKDKKILKAGVDYTVNIIAINEKGISSPSSSHSFKLNNDELPPIIWDYKAGADYISIGYSSDPTDFLYHVAYGTHPEKMEKELIVQTKGACRIPNLKPGKTYYFKMRLRKQWGFAGQWTRLHSITIPGLESN